MSEKEGGPVDTCQFPVLILVLLLNPFQILIDLKSGSIGLSMILRPFDESDSRESFSPRGPNRRLPQSDLKQESFLFQIVAKLFGPTFLDEKVEHYNF